MHIRFLRLLAGGWIVLLAGCSGFTAQFETGARRPMDVNQPLAGAWEGRWNCETFNQSGAAKAVITWKAEDSTTRLWLQLWQHSTLLSVEEFQSTKVKLEPVGNGVVKFQTKLSIRALRMIVLDGQVTG